MKLKHKLFKSQSLDFIIWQMIIIIIITATMTAIISNSKGYFKNYIIKFT